MYVCGNDMCVYVCCSARALTPGMKVSGHVLCADHEEKSLLRASRVAFALCMCFACLSSIPCFRVFLLMYCTSNTHLVSIHEFVNLRLNSTKFSPPDK